jgi:class 3 adenylate cyclase
MDCASCGHENVSDARFCGNCGKPLDATIRCPACEASNPAGQRFCNACGTALTPSGVQTEPSPGVEQAARSATPPDHLATKIRAGAEAMEGERKHVTVLFADLKGSSALLAGRDPEDARAILDPVLELMLDAVHRYEGTVNQVMGDGIMALFGAPLAHEDHAVRACLAALHMQELVRLHAADLAEKAGEPVQIRVGLNSGEVVVRSIGSDLQMDYTAVGECTHLAARMEQLARPGSIYITARTLRLAEGYVAASPLGPLAAKGMSDGVEAYELTGAIPVRSRFQAAGRAGLSSFVGRGAELDALGRALAQAGGGHGLLVAVVGEPGVG